MRQQSYTLGLYMSSCSELQEISVSAADKCTSMGGRIPLKSLGRDSERLLAESCKGFSCSFNFISCPVKYSGRTRLLRGLPVPQRSSCKFLFMGGPEGMMVTGLSFCNIWLDNFSISAANIFRMSVDGTCSEMSTSVNSDASYDIDIVKHHDGKIPSRLCGGK